MLRLLHDEPHADLGLPIRSKPIFNQVTRLNRILVIDDDRIMCLGLDIRLKYEHYDPYFAHDSESALSAALAERPDLIILDISLPDHDGYFVMRSFNGFPELSSVPIIVLTGLNTFSHQARCQDAGAKRFLEKPVANLCLMTAIRELVG
jgi:DNA-binding response OmpR family regulator